MMLAHQLCRLPRLAPSAGRRLASTATRTRATKRTASSNPKAEARPRVVATTVEKSTLTAAAAEKVPTSSILKSRTTGARRASTASTSTPPSPPPGSEPVKPASTSLPFDSSFFDVHIPEPRPEVDSLPPIQIPYVPDFWDSSNVFSSPELDEPHPKIVVVAGAETHIGGGPSHNLFDTLEESTEGVAPAESGPKFEHSDSLLDDITEDLGLPPAKEIKASFWKMFS